MLFLPGLPDGQFIGHFHLNWPISEGVGQKNKLVARNIFLANLWPIWRNKDTFIRQMGQFVTSFRSKKFFCQAFVTKKPEMLKIWKFLIKFFLKFWNFFFKFSFGKKYEFLKTRKCDKVRLGPFLSKLKYK